MLRESHRALFSELILIITRFFEGWVLSSIPWSSSSCVNSSFFLWLDPRWTPAGIYGMYPHKYLSNISLSQSISLLSFLPHSPPSSSLACSSEWAPGEPGKGEEWEYLQSNWFEIDGISKIVPSFLPVYLPSFLLASLLAPYLLSILGFLGLPSPYLS